MNTGDRVFWGMMIFIGVILVWLAGLEKIIPLVVGTIIGVAAFLILLIYGPRPKKAGAEKEEN